MPAVAAASPADLRPPPGPPPDPAPHRVAPGSLEPGPDAAARQRSGAGDPEHRARLAERLERCRRRAPPEPDPPSLADGLEAAERAAFAAVCRAFEVRLDPADCGERLLVEAFAACHFRRARLDAIEARLTRALLDGRPSDGLPSLPALARVRSALDREQRKLERDLQRLYELRPEPIRYPGLNPVRLRWLAERIEEGRLRAWSPPEPTADEVAPSAAERHEHAEPEPAPTSTDLASDAPGGPSTGPSAPPEPPSEAASRPATSSTAVRSSAASAAGLVGFPPGASRSAAATSRAGRAPEGSSAHPGGEPVPACRGPASPRAALSSAPAPHLGPWHPAPEAGRTAFCGGAGPCEPAGRSAAPAVDTGSDGGGSSSPRAGTETGSSR